MFNRRQILAGAAASAAALSIGRARAANAPGVTATEIKIGQTMPYSGPASAYSIIGRTELAYFKMLNEQGGVNGRKINLVSLDDGYSPPKTVEQVRRLVEQEQVAFLYQCLGTPCCMASRKYCNDNQIPQLMCATGASVFDDPKHFPWTTPANPIYETEGRIYGKYVLAEKANAKIGVLFQNDGLGRDYLNGLKATLGSEHAGMIVKEASYEVSEPTIDSQVTSLQGSGADLFYIAATPKFAAQAIRKSFDLGWSATRIVSNVSSSVAIMKAAGFDKAKGVVSASWGKEPTDPRWKDDPGIKQWADFVAKNMSASAYGDANAEYGYGNAIVLVQVLKQCGDDFSRENILHQATNIKDFELPTLLPGMHVNISPDNYRPIRQMKLQQFDGTTWQLFGDLIEA